MADDEAIGQIIASHGVTAVGKIVRDAEDRKRIYVSILLETDSRGTRNPSYKVLAGLKAELAAANISIQYFFNDPANADLEVGLRATLMHAFPERIRNVFCSTLKNTARAWIEPKIVLSEAFELEIREHAIKYFDLASFKLESVSLLSDDHLPGKIAILNRVRQLAPVNIERLQQALTERRFTIPSPDWLSRRLDAFRKSGDVVQCSDRTYCLSSAAIGALGSAKGRDSPDIVRMLALTRKNL